MNEEYIKKILKEVKEGTISEDEGFRLLKELPYKDMGFANIDNHRQIRTGFPEVVYCEGKTPEQIRDIFYELARHGSVMGTRADERDYEAVSRVLPDAVYHREARIIEYGARTVRNSLVAGVSGGGGGGFSYSRDIERRRLDVPAETRSHP